MTNAKPEPKDINVVQSWGPQYNDPKVPSVFTYSDGHGGKRWGFGISNLPNALKLTKLKLQTHSKLETLETLKDYLEEMRDQQIGSRPALHLLKTPTETVMDYLVEVANCVRRDIEGQRIPILLERTPIDLVITHPGVWSSFR